jgi:hypothetical protein
MMRAASYRLVFTMFILTISSLLSIAILVYAYYHKLEVELQRQRAEKVLREAEYRLIHHNPTEDQANGRH